MTLVILWHHKVTHLQHEGNSELSEQVNLKLHPALQPFLFMLCNFKDINHYFLLQVFPTTLHVLKVLPTLRCMVKECVQFPSICMAGTLLFVVCLKGNSSEYHSKRKQHNIIDHTGFLLVLLVCLRDPRLILSSL